ncbi:50S ribosomal protein L17 [Nitzschia inconspicua]|uniref:50S ribosomal protein L17 n=1 Tax=Nitzschia inconspicua TaxID=303405 RepID=A0A9K3PIH8_9STRA|nr:50S ribosomal protein L17 [Nitzschia inconspicua]
MKKRIAFRKLSRTPAHKWSMLRNQVSSLIEHERIVTTEAKAKELRHLADHVITLAKRGLNGSQKEDDPSKELHNRRRAAAIVRGDWNVSKLFDVLGPRYQFRDGGYTRVLKLARPRAGDNAPMAVIEYVDRPGEIRAARPPSVFQQQINGENVPMAALEKALRDMGIPPVDELLTKEEQEQVKQELNNKNNN